MKNNKLSLNALATMLVVFLSVFMPSSVLAHPGHDHSAKASMLIHVLFYGSIVLAIAAVAYFSYRQFNKQKNQ